MDQVNQSQNIAIDEMTSTQRHGRFVYQIKEVMGCLRVNMAPLDNGSAREDTRQQEIKVMEQQTGGDTTSAYWNYKATGRPYFTSAFRRLI